MRERLDCVILGFGDIADWCEENVGVHARGRLHLHRLDRPEAMGDDVHALAAMAATLQRYDTCLLAIGEKNLAWARQALLAAHGQLRTPIIGLVHNLKAPAIGDLYNLGMADFVRAPICIEEIRIRTERLLNMPRMLAEAHYPETVTAHSSNVCDGHAPYGQGDLYADLAGRRAGVPQGGRDVPASEYVVREPGDIELEAFAMASASRCASSSDSFAVAKSKVIGCFERAYLCASLAKSSGNITMAAREAKKHRRAYWALMRKHDIDAARFRKG